MGQPPGPPPLSGDRDPAGRSLTSRTPVAFVTGASSGLGRGMALRLARDGWAVALAARRVEALEALADEIRAAGGRAEPCPCDVSDPVAVRAAVARCRAALGDVELLVCNAGVSEMTEVIGAGGEAVFSAAAVERLLRVNFLGAVHATEAVLDGMLERDRGHLVAVGSLAGYGGLPRSAAYSASKGALHNFFESLRIDLRDTGVDVTVITPGYVDTPMTRQNDHPMPFLLDADDAVERMVRAIRERKRLLSFPRPLSTLVWLAQLFPPALYDWIGARQRREKKAPAQGDAASPPSGPPDAGTASGNDAAGASGEDTAPAPGDGARGGRGGAGEGGGQGRR